MKVIYKVVTEINGKFFSAILDTSHGNLRREYSKKFWTIAPYYAGLHGYLIVGFEDLVSAEIWRELFVDCDCRLKIFKCHAVGVTNELPPLLSLYHTVFGYLKANDFHREKFFYNQRIFDSIGNWPPGTVMAEKIKLVKRIK